MNTFFLHRDVHKYTWCRYFLGLCEQIWFLLSFNWLVPINVRRSCQKGGELSTGHPFLILQNPFYYFFNTFSILNEKTSMPSLVFIFSKLCSWNTMRKTSEKLSSVVKKQNLNKQVVEFGISKLYTSCTFWPNSTLLQGLENQFHNSILSIPCGNPAIYKTFMMVESKFNKTPRQLVGNKSWIPRKFAFFLALALVDNILRKTFADSASFLFQELL